LGLCFGEAQIFHIIFQDSALVARLTGQPLKKLFDAADLIGATAHGKFP
jgi:hypothetical protein